MLTDSSYQKGLIVLEQIKYDINYDRSILFKIVCAKLANTILNAETFSKNLTEQQVQKLHEIIKLGEL